MKVRAKVSLGSVVKGEVYEVIEEITEQKIGVDDKCGNRYIMFDDGEYEVVEEEQSKKWNGEGLPPVGVPIMIRGTPSGSICEGVIDYIDQVHCVWHWKDGSKNTMYNRIVNMEFKPIKSEKQKEVEELNKHLGHWFDNINDCIDNTFYALTLSQHLYNLGYRKTK